MKRRRVAILISGRGSNMQALIAAASSADYPAEVALVVAVGARRLVCSGRGHSGLRPSSSIESARNEAPRF